MSPSICQRVDTEGEIRVKSRKVTSRFSFKGVDHHYQQPIFLKHGEAHNSVSSQKRALAIGHQFNIHNNMSDVFSASILAVVLETQMTDGLIHPSLRLHLVGIAANASCEFQVLWHHRDAFRVDGAQIRILE